MLRSVIYTTIRWWLIIASVCLSFSLRNPPFPSSFSWCVIGMSVSDCVFGPFFPKKKMKRWEKKSIEKTLLFSNTMCELCASLLWCVIMTPTLLLFRTTRMIDYSSRRDMSGSKQAKSRERLCSITTTTDTTTQSFRSPDTVGIWFVEAIVSISIDILHFSFMLTRLCSVQCVRM